MIEFYTTVARDTIRQYMATNINLLLPASSFFENGKLYQPKLPNAPFADRAADCGGFVATRIWGDYRYSPDQYVEWLRGWWPTWAATMDFCCEDEITSGRPGIVCERQERTTEMARLFWVKYRDEKVVWVPTIQGWHVDDYRRHAQQMKPLISEMQAHYGHQFRVGIGTLCRRASVEQIHEVVRAVSSELPDLHFHLWGVKQGAIQSRIGLPMSVCSVDSAAWNGAFGRDAENWKRTAYTKEAYAFRHNLPTYLHKFETACKTPKQIPMF